MIDTYVILMMIGPIGGVLIALILFLTLPEFRKPK